jgi:hypothetical protein
MYPEVTSKLIDVASISCAIVAGQAIPNAKTKIKIGEHVVKESLIGFSVGRVILERVA